MADIEAQKTVESTVEEKKVEEKEKLAEKLEKKDVGKDDTKAEENGAKAENGDSKEESKEKDDKDSKEEPVTDKCTIKRKSTGGDAVDGKTEESTPEKKAKLDEAPAEAEANGEVTEAEAAA